MGDCSGGCGECKSADDKNKECSCDGCDCDSKYAEALNQSTKDIGMQCLLCNIFYPYSGPNRCNGTLICFNCKDTRSYLIPKGSWKKS